MTTFLARNGMDLALASVTAPLVSYGLHQMFPSPDIRFIAVAGTMNLCAMVAIREYAEDMVNKLAGKLIQKPENIYKVLYNEGISSVTRSLYSIFYVTIGTLLPIFCRFVGQRMGIPVPDYIPMMGYIVLIMNVNSVAACSINVLRTCRSYQPLTK